VPLLGVLPGTGGLTRLVDKRKVRRDLADVFCTTAEGVRADRAKAWRLVDETAKPAAFAAKVAERARTLAAASDRPAEADGVALPPLRRELNGEGWRYDHVEVALAPEERLATITVSAPGEGEPQSLEAILEAGARWWPLAMARALDDALLMLRVNAPELGTIVLKTRGAGEAVLRADAMLLGHRDNWFVREVVGMLRRTLARLDVTSRSLIAVIDEGSAFAGTLLELALAADRSYMKAIEEGANAAPEIAMSAVNRGLYPMVNGASRLATRFCGEAPDLPQGEKLDAARALELGLVTFAPDELDWDEEIRLALEERRSLSPDALSGLEANLRFPGAETMETRIFARLSAWQNWIFNRPNAVGGEGALKLFGSGRKPSFDWKRV
jgi:benzoyl-CoA-dihydrodiol lyase